MKRIFLAAWTAIALAVPGFMVTEGSIAHAMNVVNAVNVPVSGSVVNPCTSEVYDFSGYLHLLVDVTGDQAGGLHLDISDNTQGIKLVGETTGTQGIGTETDHFILNLTPGASNVTTNGQFTEITQGSSPNFIVTYLLHITVNANGTVTAVADNFKAICTG